MWHDATVNGFRGVKEGEKWLECDGAAGMATLEKGKIKKLLTRKIL